MKAGLFTRMVVSVCIATIIADIFAAVLTLTLGLARIEHQWGPRVETTRTVIRRSLAAAIEAGQQQNLDSFVDDYMQLAGVQSITVTSPDGTFQSKLSVQLRRSAPVWFTQRFGLHDRLFKDTIVSSHGVPLAEMEMVLSRLPYANGLWELLFLQLFVLSAAAILLLGIALFLLHRNLKPIASLVAATKAVGDGDFSIRLPTVGINPDLAPAFTAYNEMAGGIASLVSRLDDRQSFLTNLFQSAPVGIVQINPSGDISFINSALREFAGIETSDIKRSELLARVHPEDQQRVLDYWQSAVVTGELPTLHYRYRKTNGDITWVKSDAVNLIDSQGETIAIIGFITDTTLEQNLQRQAERISRYYLTLSQINSAIIHSANEAELYSTICRIFVEVGGFFSAAVATVDWQQRVVNMSTIFSHDKGEGSRGKVVISLDKPEAMSFTLLAILEDRNLTTNDYGNYERVSQGYRDSNQLLKISSVSSILFKRDGKTVAALTVSAREADFFTKDIIEHLEQVGVNVSHGLTSMQRARELSQAMSAVQRSEQRLDITLRSIGDAVLVTDAEGRITLMNPVAEKLTGWLEADARGRTADSVLNIINMETRQPRESPVQRVLREGTVVGLANHTLLIGKDGEERPIADSGAPIRSRDADSVDGVVLVFRDQSDEYQIQKALRESEQRYSTMVETLPIGVIVIDPINENIFANSEFRRVVGVDKPVIEADEVIAHVHPDDLPRVRQYFAEATLSNRTLSTDYFRYQHGDGSVIWVKLRFSATRDENGNVIGFIGGVLDVSAEKEHLRQIESLSVMYATLSRVNYLVVQASNQQPLINEICRIIAEVPDFDYVAYHRADWQRRVFTQECEYGRLQFSAQRFQQVSEADLSARQKLLSAMFEGKLVCVNDCSSDERLFTEPRNFAIEHGINSVVITPVKLAGQVVGTILIFSSQKNIFTDDIVELIEEVGEVTSYALNKLDAAEQKQKAELALARNEERLRLGLSVTHTGMFEVNYNSGRVFLDEVCMQLMGGSGDSLEVGLDELSTKLSSQICDKLLEIVEQCVAYNRADTFSGELQIDSPGSEPRWLAVTGAKTEERSSKGNPVRLLGVMYDITLKKQQDEREKLAACVFDRSSESIFIINDQRKIVMVNQAFCGTYGYRVEEVLNRNVRILQAGPQVESFSAGVGQALSRVGTWQGEVLRKRKDGSFYPALAVVSVVKNSQGVPTHAVVQELDISDRKEAERRISNLAYHDELTNLPNRSLLRDRVQQAIVNADREHHPLALLFLDLDHFKNINDSLGHSVGDQLLREISNRLLLAIRKADTVGRLGGDEFLILLPEVNADAAAHVAQKLLEECTRPCVLGIHTLSITPSIGIAMYPRDGYDYDELLKKADTAMYRAKDEGRNGFRFFTPEMNHAVFQRMILESALRKAIENNEFELHYQPKFSIQTMAVVGVEALLRWRQPEMGTISPAQFIPVAEDSGLITDIGRWVLLQACMQAKKWRAENLQGVKVAVNFSTRQFTNRSVEQTVFDALDESALPGDVLEIEITESLLAQDMDYIYSALHSLKSRGVSISVDDFGTGYSSLSYLKRFPIDRLKIDQSFVRDLGSDQDDRAIAEAVITMGHSLGIKVIAEGVETSEHLQILRQMNCDEVQGYYLGRPMAADEVTAILRNGFYDKPL
ncbi:EAL domain-containing protein [Halioxenophilus sp. WMMB6]|uniref:EAL domain-containing protein n=1 Tax=Halioxenophilus sp. WMMB6 TaxID=3073815 RepID=UPI00295EE10D|nr:EAL domain-containing protein [Halioxenophilus sp. WMMB6]